jgi:hypothetical protein
METLFDNAWIAHNQFERVVELTNGYSHSLAVIWCAPMIVAASHGEFSGACSSRLPTMRPPSS